MVILISLLPLPYEFSLLKKLLHVPSITKKLLSVSNSKFSIANKVFFEFFLKDQVTKETLIAGTVRNELYVFDFPKFFSKSPHVQLHQLPLCTKVSKPSLSENHTHSYNNAHVLNNTILVNSRISLCDLWHQQLGHPSFQIIKTVLTYFKTSSIGKIACGFSSACYQGKIHKFLFPRSTIEYHTPLELGT